MSIISGLIVVIAFHGISGHIFYLLMLVGVLGGLTGFLYYNWNPARVYMGDTGSQFLGVFLASISILFFWDIREEETGQLIQLKQFVVPMLFFIIPLIDTITVTFRRLLRKQSPFVGGKDHITHHLVYLGLSDKMVALILVFVSLLSLPLVLFLLLNFIVWTTEITLLAFGYFALVFVTPLLQSTILPNLPGFNMLSAGLVMGIMIIPYVSSLSEDAMHAVPMHMREASYAMGATRFQTAFRVVTPAAFSGIAAAYILGISRAMGETMVVAVAAGMQANMTWNPMEPAQTMTAYIVQVSLGDLPHGSIGYQTIFAVGLTLIFMTLIFNIMGFLLTRRFRERY